MKILLIEDDIEISEMLCSYLIAENFEVVCAADGQKACEAFDIGDLLYRNMAQIRKFLLCQFFILSGFSHFLP